MQRQATYFRVMMATLALVGALWAPGAQAQICEVYETPRPLRDVANVRIIELNEVPAPEEPTDLLPEWESILVTNETFVTSSFVGSRNNPLANRTRRLAVYNYFSEFGGAGASDIIYIPNRILESQITDVAWTFENLQGNRISSEPGPNFDPSTPTQWISLNNIFDNTSDEPTSTTEDLVAIPNGDFGFWDYQFEAMETDPQYEPGVYTMLATVNVRANIPTAAPRYAFQVFVQVALDSSKRLYVLSWANGPVPKDPYLSFRAITPDTSDLNLILQYIPPAGGNQITVPLFMGHSSGYTIPTGSSKDVAAIFTDSAQAASYELFDRTIPALSGYMRPSGASGASGDDGTVLSALDDRIDTALTAFASESGSFSLVMYTDSDEGDLAVQLVEVCFAPLSSPEGDIDPRGARLGGTPTGVINITDSILSAFFISAYEFVDTRLNSPRTSSDVSLIQPEALTISNAPNPALTANVPTDLARGFGSGTKLQGYWSSVREGKQIEFATLDVAPASSRGDGLISVADFVLTNLYVGGAGFPTAPLVGGPMSAGDRQIRLGLKPGDRTFITRGTSTADIDEIPVVLRTKGVEQTVAIGIKYDPAVLQFVSARRAGRVLDIPTFEINNNTVEGVVGLEVGLRPNRTFPLLDASNNPQDPTAPITTGANGVFSTGDGINQDEVIAYVKFQPLAGASGTVNTELEFIQVGQPLGGREPSVRSPAQSKLYSAYVSGGVTILDPGDTPSRLRLADTVLKQGTSDPLTTRNLQRVDVVLDSNGLENASGFTLQFDPTRITIAGVLPGADLTGDAFFLTNPDFYIDDVEGTSTIAIDRFNDFAARTAAANEVKVVFGLQPGATFPAGRRVVATLLVNPLVNPTGTTAVKIPVTFTKLGDLLEIVDANAIPVSSVFGREPGSKDFISVVSGACTYTVALVHPNAPVPGDLREFSLNGGTGSLNITTTANLNCAWTANTAYGENSGSGWFTFADGAEPSGTGDRSLAFSVAPFSGTGDRTVTVTIGGAATTITQRGCGIDAQFATVNDGTFTGLGGNGSILIDARANTCAWNAAAVSEGGWIRFVVPGGAQQTTLTGVGDTTVNFIVDPNTGEARTGTITIGEDIELTIRQDFTFSSSSEGWLPSVPFSPLFTNATAQYVQPAVGSDDNGRLVLSTVNNTNTFGYWESTLFTLTPDTDALYRATFRVTTDVASLPAVPSFRLRASTADFAQSAEFKVDSFAAVDSEADASPTQSGVTYEHYFNLPRNQSQFRMFFDIINFDPSDAPVASISLNSMAVAKFSRAGLADTRAEGAPIISKDTPFLEIPIAQVYGRTAEQMIAPSFIADARGQLVRAGSVDPTAQKASIGILTKFTDKTLSTNRLYEARFTVTSRSALSATVRKEMVPTFRLRVGEGSGQISSLLNIESINADSIVPTLSESEIYSVWLGSNTAIVNNALNFSLDFVYETSGQNDPAIGLIIEKVEVFSYARP